MPTNPFSQHLDKCAANYQPLTPLPFLERAAAVHPEHVAVIHGRQRFTYARALRALPPSRLGTGAARHRRQATPSR